MYFVYRNGTYHNAAGQSFRDFLEGKLPALPGAGWGRGSAGGEGERFFLGWKRWLTQMRNSWVHSLGSLQERLLTGRPGAGQPQPPCNLGHLLTL